MKASNRAAALRIPEHLALINFVVVRPQTSEDDGWKAALVNAIDRHVDRLAQAEHLGWWATPGQWVDLCRPARQRSKASQPAHRVVQAFPGGSG